MQFFIGLTECINSIIIGSGEQDLMPHFNVLGGVRASRVWCFHSRRAAVAEFRFYTL